MRRKLAVAVVGVSLVLTGTVVSVSAHHAFAAEFDANRPVNFEGTVTKMEWLNPHVWIHLDVKMPDGSTESWAFEGGTPNVAVQAGLYEAVAAAGDEDPR